MKAGERDASGQNIRTGNNIQTGNKGDGRVQAVAGQEEVDAIVQERLDGGVLTLTLNNPGARNSLSEAMMAGLQAALDAAGQDKRARVIVIAANGPAFSAG